MGYGMPKSKSLYSILPIWCALVLSAGGAFAQSAGPQPLPMPAQIAAPKDTPYLGAIRLTVDATDIERHIFNVRETIPVRAGESDRASVSPVAARQSLPFGTSRQALQVS